MGLWLTGMAVCLLDKMMVPYSRTARSLTIPAELVTRSPHVGVFDLWSSDDRFCSTSRHPCSTRSTRAIHKYPPLPWDTPARLARRRSGLRPPSDAFPPMSELYCGPVAS